MFVSFTGERLKLWYKYRPRNRSRLRHLSTKSDPIIGAPVVHEKLKEGVKSYVKVISRCITANSILSLSVRRNQCSADVCCVVKKISVEERNYFSSVRVILKCLETKGSPLLCEALLTGINVAYPDAFVIITWCIWNKGIKERRERSKDENPLLCKMMTARSWSAERG